MTDIIATAEQIAREVHAGHERKGSGLPYFDAHVAPVAAIVRDTGGSDVQIAAAYLHDTAEDGGGEPVLDRIATEVSPEVAEIVRHLSDSLVDTTSGTEKEDWEVRKLRYIAGLAHAPDEVLEVSVCDKLHNAQSILADLRSEGPAVWDRFSKPEPEYSLWYYRELAHVFAHRIGSHPATATLTETVAAITDGVRATDPDIESRVDAVSEQLRGPA